LRRFVRTISLDARRLYERNCHHKRSTRSAISAR
jgi:hypothetical protein